MTLDAVLERLQDLSGLGFSAFLVMHLASPVAAALGTANPEAAASNMQLATRVVYQDGRLRELCLVWIPLGTHILVGIVRRITRINRRRRIRAQLELRARQAEPLSASDRPPRWTAQPPTTWEWLKSYLPTTAHALTGYVGIPLLLDHIFHHRLSAPPALRSFRFVAFSLQYKPVLSLFKYSAILSALVYHALVGLDQIQSRAFINAINHPTQSSPKTLAESQRTTSIRLAWLGIIGTVGFGIRKLAREEIPPWIARKYM